jgi:uncharacterized protein (TIGR02145 family)
MRIQILQGTTNGTAVYTETQTLNTNVNGLVSTEIGGANSVVTLGNLSTIDWSSNTYYLKVETDIEGGANYTISGTSQLLSVPYALHAKTAQNISGLGNLATTSELNALKAKVDDIELRAGIQTVADVLGKVYKVVKIGNQVWMAENLQTLAEANGTSIPSFSNTNWGNLVDNDTDKGRYRGTDPVSGDFTTETFYSYAAALDACPQGWHLPSIAEWTTLKTYLNTNGYNGNGAYALKSTTGWSDNGYAGVNAFGFNAIPSGFVRHNDGVLSSQGESAVFWSSTSDNNEQSFAITFFQSGTSLSVTSLSYKSLGRCVRCLKDSE